MTGKLEEKGFAVFLPQRDGVDSSTPPHNEMTNDELHQAIFAVDQDKGLEADVFLVVLDGRVPYEGAYVALTILPIADVIQTHFVVFAGYGVIVRSARQSCPRRGPEMGSNLEAINGLTRQV